MSGIQRFVTYLYLYEGDDKIRNTGFAKVEIRGDQCRLEIHIKSAGLVSTASPIYLFSREDKIMHAVEIGKMNLQGGSGDYKGLLKSVEIGHSPYGIRDMQGMLILVNEQYMFASQWDDGSILRRNIHIWEPRLELPKEEPPAQMNRNREMMPGRAVQVNQSPEMTDGTVAQAEPSREMTAAQAEQNRRMVRNAPLQPGESPQTQKAAAEPVQETSGIGTAAATMRAAQQPVTFSATEMPMRKFQKELARPQETLLDAYLRLQKRIEDMDFMQGENTRICGIHIELKDIRELPKRYWYLGNNSFLLHGFFNYRYLMLGKKMTEESESIFLGVPGVFSGQERVMAALFGFPEFLPENRAQFEQNQAEGNGNQEVFGYWCHVMPE